MTTPHRTLQMALDALDAITDDVDGTGLNTMPSFDKALDAIAALREALNAPEPEPYGHVTTHTVTGQQFFYRYPSPPYLDTAKECIAVYAAPPAAPDHLRDIAEKVAPAAPVPDALVEAVAKAIYWEWRRDAGYVPWVDGGNSLKQDDARKIARAVVSSAAPVPDGWVMVPREPTPEMIAAMPYPANTIPAVGVACYRAMIAASPAAPAAPAVREPLTDAQIDKIFDDAHENMPKGELFRTFVTRAIERAHGIGGGGK